MEIEIRNERQLTEWENHIGFLLQRHDLDYVLGGVRASLDKLKPFDAAGISLFAIRFSLPPIARPHDMRVMPWSELAPLANIITQYLISDPITFDRPANDTYQDSTIIPLFLRFAGNQFPFDVTFFGQYARALKLFYYIPRELRARRKGQVFDLESAFENIAGISLRAFIDVGYGCLAVATSKSGFTGGWFQKARTQGMRFTDEVVAKALDQLAADQWRLRELYEAYKQTDRRFGMHDFNPLFVYPIVRPWPKRIHTTLDEDRLIAPIPNLILSRLSDGIYKQLVDVHRQTFSQYFGSVFQAYVGEILKESVSGSRLLNEEDIKRHNKSGKIPDYVVIDGGKVILIECKATGFQQKAFAMADARTIDQSVSRIVDGLIQLYEFRKSCESHPLENLGGGSDFIFVLVTLEPFYIINSVDFKEVIKKLMARKLNISGIEPSPWYVFSVDELERLQPHLAAGINLSTVIEELLNHRTFNDVLKDAAERSSRCYKDSFLYEMDNEIWDRLNISDLYKQQNNRDSRM
jgi:hypothetical protein